MTTVTRWQVERSVMLSDLPPAARHLMHALAVYADAKTATIPPEHSPSLTVLADATGYARRYVMRLLDRLERGGWVVRHRPPVEQSRKGARTRYRLTVPRDLQVPTVGTPRSLAVGTGEHKPRDPQVPHRTTTTDNNQERAGLALVIETLEVATGKTVSEQDAVRAVAFICNGRSVRDPYRYAVKVIREDANPRRFLPTPTPPPYRRREG